MNEIRIGLYTFAYRNLRTRRVSTIAGGENDRDCLTQPHTLRAPDVSEHTFSLAPDGIHYSGTRSDGVGVTGSLVCGDYALLQAKH